MGLAVILGQLLLAAPGQPVEAASTGTALVVLSVQNRVGDLEAAAAVDDCLRRELGRIGRIVGTEETRNALRRLRVRNGDHASPTAMRLLGGRLGARWLVSTTLHEAERRAVPSLAVSARVYSVETGNLVWTAFQGKSGLDRRGLLGLGTIASLESLAPLVVRDLVAGLAESLGASGPVSPHETRAGWSRLGTVAVVPFTGSTSFQATQNAETVTEAVRATIFDDGARLVSPNRLSEIIRHLQAGRWGGVTLESREALCETGGADVILTGAVEAFDIGGADFEPDPQVTLGLRLLDARSGRILWSGSEERGGRDHEGLFRHGRVYSRGALALRTAEALTRRLLRDRAALAQTRRGETP